MKKISAVVGITMLVVAGVVVFDCLNFADVQL
jgi:hypothetical protein